jgi:hypothetical protein
MRGVLGDQKKRGNGQKEEQYYAAPGAEPTTRLVVMLGGHGLHSSNTVMRTVFITASFESEARSAAPVPRSRSNA